MVISSVSRQTGSVELFVNRLILGGDGLAELDGLKVFVPFAAPEERVRARIVLRKRDYAVAQIEEVIEPSPLRIQPACPYYGRCGGCQLQHISYTGQLVVKKLLVNDALQHLGKIYVPVKNIKFQSAEWRYRNKTQYPVGAQKNLLIGFYEKRSHRLIDISACLLHPELFDDVRQILYEAIIMSGEKPYDERAHLGNVRHIILRQGGDNGVLVILVTRTKKISSKIVARLADLPQITGVVQSVNPERTNRILGKEMTPLYGKDYINQVVLGKGFRVSAKSFFQVNISQTEELARKVINFVEPSGYESVVDLFSGVGMLSLIIADKVKKVIGIEIEPSAVADARFNAEMQMAKNVQFIEGDVNEHIAQIDSADIVILDPPRKGCDFDTLRQIARLKPNTIVYISCNPATLARDLAVLEELGFTCQEVEPVDMFPQTAHIEVITKLVRKG